MWVGEENEVVSRVGEGFASEARRGTFYSGLKIDSLKNYEIMTHRKAIFVSKLTSVV